MSLSQETREAAGRLVRRYPVARSALLPLLHLVQADHGHVTEEGIAFCADTLGLTKAEVGAVATFYTMFKREPVGDWLLSVCTNPPCRLAGAEQIVERYRERLADRDEDDDGTDASVEHAECLGICDAAPVVQVNYEMYGPLTLDEAEGLLDAVLDGEPPASNWSGEAPPTFREVAWELSGAADGLDEEWIAAARQQVVDHEVPPAYRTGETDVPVTHPGGDARGHGGEAFRREGGAAPGSMIAADGRATVTRPTAEPVGTPSAPAIQAATGGVGDSRPGGVATPLESAASGDDGVGEPQEAAEGTTGQGIPADGGSANGDDAEPGEES